MALADLVEGVLVRELQIGDPASLQELLRDVVLPHLRQVHQQKTRVEIAMRIAAQCAEAFRLLFNRSFEDHPQPVFAQRSLAVQLPDVLPDNHIAVDVNDLVVFRQQFRQQQPE